MKLNEFIDRLNEVVPDYEIPEYNVGSLIDALTANKPYLALEEVFGEAFYPKVKRWLDDRLKNVKAPKDADNLVGGEFGAKLDTFLQKETTSNDEYRDNAELLAREILNAIKEWDKRVVKPQDLPEPRFS